MFQTIGSKISWPDWCDDRYKRLATLERCVNGEFYDHIKIPFVVETQGDAYIPITDRRPSVQYNLPHMLAVDVSRWLWAGRNRPEVVNEDNLDLQEAARDLVKESHMVEKVAEATIFGSVGSVAITFQIQISQEDGKPHLIFDTWRAKDCTPTFSDADELRSLRVQYQCRGSSFLSQGVTKAIGKSRVIQATKETLFRPDEIAPIPVDIDPDAMYWFTRDYDTQQVYTYIPIEADAYSPKRPDDQILLRIDPERSAPHMLGFVPGVWIRNLPGGDHPDGACTFKPAMNTSIVLDYTLSQMPRGLWYNMCPQVVLEGELLNQLSDQNGRYMIKGPTNIIQFPSVDKGIGGQATGGGKAYLLESNGKIFETAQAFCEFMVATAKDQIHASRKDPDKLTTAQSGVAINAVEEEHLSLVNELREGYGDHGFLPLLEKAMRAAWLADMIAVAVEDHHDLGFKLQYRRPQITPEQFGLIEPALVDAVSRKLLIPKDVAMWMIAVLDLPQPPPDWEPDEDAGLPPAPPVDPNKQAALAARPKPKPTA